MVFGDTKRMSDTFIYYSYGDHTKSWIDHALCSTIPNNQLYIMLPL